ncbi:MAG: toxin [Bacteroidales bacterium]|nr:toxin [Bacteroidales bacterium]
MNLVKTEQEVEAFLRQFKPKLSVWGIFFIRRDKNIETIEKLSLTETIQYDIVKTLDVPDYVHTVIDDLQYGDMWVFGKTYKNTNLYIKISLGRPNSKTICISFHEAEFPLTFPFK